jgi:hypothetical protein
MRNFGRTAWGVHSSEAATNFTLDTRMIMPRSAMRLSALTSLGVLLVACGDSNNGSSTQPVVQLNFASHPAGTTSASRLASIAVPYTITDADGNSITYESVQMVLREIELKRADRDVVCADGENGDDGTSASDCEELEFGPVLFDVPLGAGPVQALSVEVAAGSYDKLEFKVHKPSSSDDAAFVAANPTFDGVSIRATGSYTPSGGSPQAFTYTTDLDVEQEQEFSPPLAVVDGQATELTVLVNLDGWFRNGSGTFVDPASGNKSQPNEGLVKSNIESSLQAFEDGDHDGSDD